MAAKGRQISVRVPRETDAWLERRAGGRSNKAEYVRRLIEREMVRDREESLFEVFNRAAADVTDADLAERDELLGAFVANDEPKSPRAKPKTPKKKGKGAR